MKKSENFQLDILKKEAKGLVRKGFSVLAVQGNNLPERPKQPATMWRSFSAGSRLMPKSSRCFADRSLRWE